MAHINRRQLILLQWKNLLNVYSYEFYRREFIDKQNAERRLL